MLNFDTKRRILKKLNECSKKNALLKLLCTVAAAAVNLFYRVACGIDMAFSDKNGNFLGIKHRERNVRKKKQDDIVYVKRSLRSRLVSGVLAASFSLMSVPFTAIPVFAADEDVVEQIRIYGEVDAGKQDVVRTTMPDGRTYYYKAAEGALTAPAIVSGSCVAATGAFELVWDDMSAQGDSISNVEKFVVTATPSIGNISGAVSTTIKVATKAPDNSKDRYSYVFGGENRTDKLDTGSNYDFVVAAQKTVALYRWYDFYTDAEGVTYENILVPCSSSDPTYSYTKKTLEKKSAVETMKPYAEIGDYDGSAKEKLEFTAEYVEGSLGADGSVKNDRIILRRDHYKYADDPDENGNQRDEVSGYLLFMKREDGDYNLTPVMTISAERLDAEKDLVIEVGDNGLDLDPTTIYSFALVAYKDVFAEKQGEYVSRLSHQYIYSSPIDQDGLASTRVCTQTIHTKTEMPVGLKVTQATDESTVTLSWTHIKKANEKTSKGQKYPVGYYVYRFTEEEVLAGNLVFDPMGQNVIQTVDNSVKYDVSTSVADNTTYYYYVSAYRQYGNADAGDMSSIVESKKNSIKHTFDIETGTPINLYATPEDGKIDLTWKNTDKYTDGYFLYITQLTDKDGNPIEKPETITVDIEDGKSSTYSHTGILNGEKYRYEIQAYKITNKVKEPTSNKSEAVEAIAGLTIYPPQNITAEPEDGMITVTWDKVNRAEEYVLYIFKHNPDGTRPSQYTDMKVIAAPVTKYEHKNLYNGDKYSYYVKARKYVSNVAVDSEASDLATATVGIPLVAPTDLTAKVSEDKVDVSWSKVSGAQGYYLYIVDDNGKIVDTVEVTKTKYTHYAEHGERYKYYVVAYKYIQTPDGMQKYFGPESETIAATAGVALDPPADVTVKTEDGQNTVTWSAVKGAEGYFVYAMCDGVTTTFQVTKNKFVHTGVTSDKTYVYFVKAYKDVNNERIFSEPSMAVSTVAGEYLAAPKDFRGETDDANAVLTWSAVKGAEGYTVYAYKDGESLEFDVSKNKFTHTGLKNGDVWHYYVKAFKTIDRSRVYSDATHTIDLTIGASLNAPVDLFATSGDRQIDLSWTKVNNAEGYVVYIYNEGSESFVPLTVVSKTKYSHVGLKNGTKYTYMVAAFRTINGERVYGAYSMAVSAMPSKGTAADLDSILNVKGTAPYGISHSEMISVVANHEAFDEPVDVYFSVNEQATNAVKNVLKHFANGLSSFIIYPFDISTYLEGTLIAVDPNPGFSVTVTMPIPDKLVKYRDYITVVHIDTHGSNVIEEDSSEIFTDSADLEVLPSAVMLINDVWCIQFAASNFSPFALVIYKDNLMDVSSEAAAEAGTSAGTFNTGLLLFTALPDIMPGEKKTKFVVSRKKYYRIKK